MKFNATITFASLSIINLYIKKSTSYNFYDLMKEFPLLLEGFKGVIKQHYSSDFFRSLEVKSNILQPYLKTFK